MTGAGDLRYRVQCQSRGGGPDGEGNVIPGPFETRFTCAAAFKHLRGGEDVMAARLENRHPMLVTLRRSSQTQQITADWRLVDARNGATFAVKDVTAETDRKWITLLVESGGAA